jgi:hypothetical protein
MSATYPHDSGYFPPIPTLKLTLQSFDAGKTTDALSAVVDTGADITLVPVSLFDRDQRTQAR